MSALQELLKIHLAMMIFGQDKKRLFVMYCDKKCLRHYANRWRQIDLLSVASLTFG